MKAISLLIVLSPMVALMALAMVFPPISRAEEPAAQSAPTIPLVAPAQAAAQPSPAVAQPSPAPTQPAAPEIRLKNSAPEIAFGRSIMLDTTPSANIHQILWTVHPEDYESDLNEIAPGKSLFTCMIPGSYVFFGAASNASGDLTTYRYAVQILPPSGELLDEMRRQSESVGGGAGDDRAVRPRAARNAQSPLVSPTRTKAADQANQDEWGLRTDVEAIVRQLAAGSGSFNWSPEAKRMASAYDGASTDILARQQTGELALGTIRQHVDGVEEGVRKKWANANNEIRKRLDALADEGKLPTYDRWHVACQVVSESLGEVR